MAYDSSTLHQTGVWNLTANGGLGGVWQSGAALAADSNGVYLATGNGTFDWNTGGRDLSDSVVKLGSPSAGMLPDWITLLHSIRAA